MIRNRFALAAGALALVVSAVTLGLRAQQRSPQFIIESLSDAKGQVGLGLALRKLTTVGTFMHTTAHPDDENNGILALYARGHGMRAALLTATRGDGGQNEIGPELFDAIGVLRTEELLQAHRWDGAEQYFTRAVDFGYSFSPEETIQKWGHDEILGDFVRMIRTIRPDVMVTLNPAGTGGGQHHQVSATLSCHGRRPSRSCSGNFAGFPNARLTNPYWVRLPDSGRAELEADPPYGLPFRPSPFRARFDFDINGVAVTHEMPVQYRYEGDLATGEKRMELNVVPGLSLHVEPSVMIVPLKVAAGVDRRKDVRVTVENNTKGPATANVGLKVPAGWRVLPATQPVSLGAEGESTTVRFTVTPPAAPPLGQVALKAEATAARAPDLTGSEQFTNGYQVIEYPHIQRRHKVIPAETTVKVVDVGVAANIRMGYVMGVGDLVPQALDQLGVKVAMIDTEELAYGNLARYDTIMLGIRAYERRADLKAYNHRLIKYVNDGGTLIVQYNKTAEFNQAQYGPYPALVSSNRVTDETAPVQILEKEHHAFTYPNRIRQDAWDGWVQERGLYFLGEKDAKYTDLVQLQDPFEYNPGMKGGALVEARLGKGRWIYVGLGLWRQLPYGTVGAYQLMANLISLGKVPKSAAATR